MKLCPRIRTICQGASDAGGNEPETPATELGSKRSEPIVPFKEHCQLHLSKLYA